MDEMITQFAEIGIIGVIAFTLFKNTLESHKQQIKYYQDEIEFTRNAYKEELKADRECYTNSITKIATSIHEMTTRIDTIEDDVKVIRDKISRV